MDPDLQPSLNDSQCPTEWQAKPEVTPEILWRRFIAWLREQSILIEAFWVAVSFHILLFPAVWFLGWALPWPQPPTITTVIELNIENWPVSASPVQIDRFYETEKSKASHKQK